MNFDILRQKILEKAIRGELVPQLESEPEVVQIGEGPEKVLFTIPGKWKWVKLENIGRWKSGGTPSRSHREYYENGTIPWLKTGDLNDGVVQSVGEYITNSGLENSSAHINPVGSVLIAMYGATIGKVGVLQFPCATNQACCACVPKESLCDQWYLFFFLLSQRKNFIALGAGGAQPNISRSKIVNSWISLPPLGEQHRIVKKINQLFAQIDCAEKAYNELSGPLSERFRQLCLEKAIQGKLVPQLENEPEVAPIGEAPEDVPFAIPEKWKWVSASYVQTLVRGVTFPASAKAKTQTNNSICCLTTGSVQEKYANKADVFVDQSFMKNTRQILQVGDVVISSANSKELVGKSILWEDNSGVQKTFGGFLTVARVKDSQSVIPEYLFLVYRYMFKIGYFANLSAQTTNIANLSNKLLDSLVFPIPPLEEQRRIAAKLNELLGAVVQLENTISAT